MQYLGAFAILAIGFAIFADRLWEYSGLARRTKIVTLALLGGGLTFWFLVLL